MKTTSLMIHLKQDGRKEKGEDKPSENPDRKYLIVDLSKSTYIDSVGLAVLIGLHKITQRDNNRELSVVAPNPIIKRIFEITNLDTIFTIYSSLDEAMKAYEAMSTVNAGASDSQASH